MYNDDDGDDENFEIPNISHSVYIDTNELSRYLEDHENDLPYWVSIFRASMQNLIYCMHPWPT